MELTGKVHPWVQSSVPHPSWNFMEAFFFKLEVEFLGFLFVCLFTCLLAFMIFCGTEDHIQGMARTRQPFLCLVCADLRLPAFASFSCGPLLLVCLLPPFLLCTSFLFLFDSVHLTR